MSEKKQVKARTLWILRNKESGKYFRGFKHSEVANKLLATRYTSAPADFVSLGGAPYIPEVLVEVTS